MVESIQYSAVAREARFIGKFFLKKIRCKNKCTFQCFYLVGEIPQNHEVINCLNNVGGDFSAATASATHLGGAFFETDEVLAFLG